MLARTTVRLAELLDRARCLAVAEGRTLSSLVEEGLRCAIDDAGPPRRSSQTLPPVSSATGGLRPGISLTHMSDIQALDDLEYMERIRRFDGS